MASLLVRRRIDRVSRLPESAAVRAPNRRRNLLLCTALALDETLVLDLRASLRPAQIVERKLMTLLKNVYVPVSQVRATVLYRGRGPLAAPSAQPELLREHRAFK